MPPEVPGVALPGVARPEHARLVDMLLRTGPAVPPPVRQHLLPLPLGEVLELFAAAAPRVARHPLYWRYGREVVGVPEPQLEQWYTQAWWGTCASAACENRMVVLGREQEVLDRIDPIDWTPLDTLLAQGKGVLLCGSHWGVPHVLPASLARTGRHALAVGHWYQRHAAPGTDLSRAGEPAGLTRLYLQAFQRLREGGLAQIVPDGWYWRVSSDARFFGHPCRVSLAPAALARLTGAPALPYMTIWEGQRMKIVFGTAWVPEQSSGETGEGDAADGRWMRRYLDWLEGMARAHPQVVRFNFLTPRVPLVKEDAHVAG
jgi:lauroyl/myristoyl acyltransferase